jgi:putative DNA primase/helicase
MSPVFFQEEIQRKLGFAPAFTEIVPGKLIRFSTSDRRGDVAGWCRLFDDQRGGIFGDWRYSTSETWQASQAFTPQERAIFSEQVQKTQTETAKIQAEKRAECRKKSADLWGKGRDIAVDHPYIVAKSIRPMGIRQIKNMLMVPVRDTAGLLHGLQMIMPDGTKKFKTGTAVGGNYLAIGKPDGRIFIAEGYATAVTIHEATGAAVAVAFNCGNLKPVAVALREKYPNEELVLCADDDLASEGNPGLIKATEAARAVSGKLAVPCFPGNRQLKDSDFNDLARLGGIEAVRLCIEKAETVADSAVSRISHFSLEVTSENKTEAQIQPIPLTRQMPQSEAFPYEAFPRAMQNAACRMKEVIQAPGALIGQSLLAGVTLAVQPHVDVFIDGRLFPVSENFITIGASGERKSACDREANRVIRERQQQDHCMAVAGKVELDAAQAAWESTRRKITSDRNLSHGQIKIELEALGECPMVSTVMRYTEEPTYEGLVKGYAEGNLSMGLFSDEGGRFLGGFAMSQENATKTITGLSKLWDGDHISRSRGGDGNFLIYGVRLSVHLMIQPVLSDKVFADPLLSGQGFLSRCLCVHPESTIGARPYKSVDLSTDLAMTEYHEAMKQVIDIPAPKGQPGMGLNPRRLTLAPSAKSIWIKFHDHIEALQKDSGPLHAIRGFASKAAEHAARLAAILSFFDNPDGGEIGTEHTSAGIELVQYYIGEALRLFNSAATNPDLLLAEKVLSWAKHHDRAGLISLIDLYQVGPRPLRDKAGAQKIINILVEHNQAVRVEGGCDIGGTFRRDVWRIASE